MNQFQSKDEKARDARIMTVVVLLLLALAGLIWWGITRPPDTSLLKEPAPLKSSDAPQANSHPFGYG
jgi:flagellar basal body-associated protein FliL